MNGGGKVYAMGQIALTRKENPAVHRPIDSCQPHAALTIVDLALQPAMTEPIRGIG
jgi:hypothetical protein